ncbi:primosomal protein N' [Motiliproteus sp.]|uniref:primosomal protein N' n=1 Tax=Motiliproteus sp. TaxID=1898955 RepID=UPI003BA8AD30
MSRPGRLLRVALPSPLRRYFDYLPPETAASIGPGQRVRVPFGRRQLVGVVVDRVDQSDVPENKLRAALECLDEQSVLPLPLLELALWSASYYHYPPGEVLATFLPVLLRQGEAAEFRSEHCWVVNDGVEPDQLKNAPRQQALFELLMQHPHGLADEALRAQQFSSALVRALHDRGFISRQERPMEPLHRPEGDPLQQSPLPLNEQQQQVLDQLNENPTGFSCNLLQGVTGSGKTEVYLQLIEAQLRQGRQSLVLVPEIGLTPQTVSRFRARFRVPVVALHSGLNDRERLDAWLQAGRGMAGIVIGTRSAVLTPLARLGMIVIDEEHDGSFKQQEGFRYSARDLAVMRAQREQIPVLLGSATPSLESLHNAIEGRYRWLKLSQRAGGARAPSFELLDICHQPLDEGLSEPLIQRIGQHLARNEQVLVFLNRRGFAPSLMCHDCGWVADCPQCDARLTLHRSPARLHCHHCDLQLPLTGRCGDCNSTDLNAQGAGTERTEATLQRLFENYPVLRVDRDSTQRKHALQKILEQVNEGGPCILVGTQMLAKGHHFPKVTLVAILDADGGLFSADFRGMEKTAQLVLQVAGRAGRAEHPGHVIMQTHHAEHPRLRSLIEQDYTEFARQELSDRRLAKLPPYRYLVLLRAEAVAQGRAEIFLQWVRELIEQHDWPGVSWLGPLPSPMEKRAGRYRAQLLIEADQRKPLHPLLSWLSRTLEEWPQARKVRWSLDVDPIDNF